MAAAARAPLVKEENIVAVGDQYYVKKRFSKEELQLYSQISLDNNPLHLDSEFAKTSIFGRPVVHWSLIYA